MKTTVFILNIFLLLLNNDNLNKEDMDAFCVRRPDNPTEHWNQYILLLNMWDKSRSSHDFPFKGDANYYYGLDKDGMRYASGSPKEFDNNIIKLSEAIIKMQKYLNYAE